ncbi:MAG: PAS and ANTAR domain-containing protein [Nocardioides sp.]
MEKVVFDGSQPATTVGYYSYLVSEDLWSWSDAVYLLHGYTPREVPATTEILLRHKHPDDRSRAAEVLDVAIQDGEPFSCYHRIIDKQEHLRSVLSVGRGIEDSTGHVERVEGYFVDLTDPRREETQSEVRRALAGMAEHRETIDIAKGMVMLATGCDSATAFACLRRYSQNANLKLHVVAQHLVAAGPSIGQRAGGVIALLNDLAPSHSAPPTL